MKEIYKKTHGMISVDKISPSKTNPRRSEDFKGADFDELVASIKEKGVLMPILLRPTEHVDSGLMHHVSHYEIVAGERRFRASVVAGLKEIPAQIVTMTDEEAREAQIVENLQRKDIHPLEEGEAYRKLVEQSKQSVETIAAKVGKSVTYVRQRLLLTNLLPAAGEMYRKGTINDSYAVVFARLAPKFQKEIWQWFLDESREYDNVFRPASLKDLRKYIQEVEFTQLRDTPPWKDDESKLKNELVECQECAKTGKETLFGKEAPGQCADPACYARKMAAWVTLKRKEYQDAKKPLTLVSMRYGSEKGQKYIRRNEFEQIEGKNDECPSAHEALVVEGDEKLGKVIRICSDKKCKKHNREFTPYAPSPKEVEKRKAERKKELAKAKAKAAAREKTLADALTKVKWPLADKHLDALFTLAFTAASVNTLRNIAKRHELNVKKDKKSWGGEYYNYAGAVKAEAAKLTKQEKTRLTFELLIDTGYDSLREGVGKL